MTYLPGQRIAVVRTSDPDTDLTPGAQGTVIKQDGPTLHVRWDSGSTLSLLLDVGDNVRSLGPVEDVRNFGPVVHEAAPPLTTDEARALLSGNPPPVHPHDPKDDK